MAQEPYHGRVILGSQDRDNFVRDLRTTVLSALTGADDPNAPPTPGPPDLTSSVRTVPPVLTLPVIKAHCHIELDETADDPILRGFEMAARLHTQNILRQDFGASVGENIKLAMLVLIAHWYRNREAVITGTVATMIPLGYTAILFPKRDFPPGVY